MFVAGGVYRFSYLWAWQCTRGEETGRKVRPVCLVMKNPQPNGPLFLFPITTVQPGAERIAIEIPPSERLKAGLDKRCWLIVDEYNRTRAEMPYDFDSTEPIGVFSLSFLRRVATEVVAAARGKRIQGVDRS